MDSVGNGLENVINTAKSVGSAVGNFTNSTIKATKNATSKAINSTVKLGKKINANV